MGSKAKEEWAQMALPAAIDLAPVMNESQTTDGRTPTMHGVLYRLPAILSTVLIGPEWLSDPKRGAIAGESLTELTHQDPELSWEPGKWWQWPEQPMPKACAPGILLHLPLLRTRACPIAAQSWEGLPMSCGSLRTGMVHKVKSENST